MSTWKGGDMLSSIDRTLKFNRSKIDLSTRPPLSRQQLEKSSIVLLACLSIDMFVRN